MHAITNTLGREKLHIKGSRVCVSEQYPVNDESKFQTTDTAIPGTGVIMEVTMETEILTETMQAVTKGCVNMITQAEDIVTETTRDATRVVVMAMINMMEDTVVEVTYMRESKAMTTQMAWTQYREGVGIIITSISTGADFGTSEAGVLTMNLATILSDQKV